MVKKKVITVNKKMLIIGSQKEFLLVFPSLKSSAVSFSIPRTIFMQTSLDEFIIPSINQIFQSINHSADFYL